VAAIVITRPERQKTGHATCNENFKKTASKITLVNCVKPFSTTWIKLDAFC